jgi:hypothetical protein
MGADIVELKKDNTETAFKLGDVVTLKSDPDVGMTVRSATKTKVIVDWINGNKDACAGEFNPKQLQLRDEIEPPAEAPPDAPDN